MDPRQKAHESYEKSLYEQEKWESSSSMSKYHLEESSSSNEDE